MIEGYSAKFGSTTMVLRMYNILVKRILRKKAGRILFPALTAVIVSLALSGGFTLGSQPAALGGSLGKPYPSPILRESGDPGENILRTGNSLVYEEERIITGSCWDFVDAVYNAAGYPDGRRHQVFKGKQEGPYADPNALKAGDWVMHWNVEHGRITHSSIFVEWSDRDRKIATTLDYAGRNKNITARYSRHEYSKIFCILRPEEKNRETP